MNDFNGVFAKAFPERTAANIAAVARQEAFRKSRNPFGGALSEDEPSAFSKLVHHHFENGNRVVVNSPNHHTHGHAGVITDSQNDNRLEVKLDSGHTIHCSEADLIPEDLPDMRSDKVQKARGMIETPDAVATIVNSLKRGDNVTLPTRLQKTCEKYPALQKLISAGRIRFQETTFF